MRSPLGRTTAIALVVVFLAPGLLQAGTSVRLNGPASEPGFFSMAWSLLTTLWAHRGSEGSSAVKNGGQAEPSGSTGGGAGGAGGNSATGGEGGGGDNGGQAEPSG
jgi:hypothetical protein